MQTRLWSAFEIIASTAIGFVVAMVSQLYIFPMYGINIHLDTNLKITGWFTLISIVRGYLIRRMFNVIAIWKQHGHPRR